MPNNTLFANVSSSIADAFTQTVGVNDSLKYILVGVFILIIFMYWIWSSNLGIYGMIVIVPALVGLLTFGNLGFLPEWFGWLIWIIVAIIWALIFMRLVGER